MNKEIFVEDVLTIYNNIIGNMDENRVKDSKDVLHNTHELDSLGVVEFVIEIEEKYNISLENVLVDIRGAQKVEEIINIVYDAIYK